jgi:hypothetical protein
VLWEQDVGDHAGGFTVTGPAQPLGGKIKKGPVYLKLAKNDLTH